jgi:type I restriction enzyme R subunit
MNILFQITFIQKIIDYLNINGILEKTMLTQPPFNDLDDNGVIGIFPDEEKLVKVIKLIEEVN